MRETGRWIGDPVGSPAPASEPTFGWRSLFIDPGAAAPTGRRAEDVVAHTLRVRYGLDVLPAGERSQSYDLELTWAQRSFSRIAGLEPGKYEVKSLWRKNENRSFDPRFKVGQRGERIYGYRDSLIKSFAVALERQIDYVLEHAVKYGPRHGRYEKGELTTFVEETQDFIEQATQRRHSKSFSDRLERLARVSQHIPTMLPIARTVLYNRVQASDIVNGFSDLEGIFVVAGPMYTMVTKAEMPELLSFDSVSSEGLKLRYTKNIPTDKSEKEKEGKGNGV